MDDLSIRIYELITSKIHDEDLWLKMVPKINKINIQNLNHFNKKALHIALVLAINR